MQDKSLKRYKSLEHFDTTKDISTFEYNISIFFNNVFSEKENKNLNEITPREKFKRLNNFLSKKSFKKYSSSYFLSSLAIS